MSIFVSAPNLPIRAKNIIIGEKYIDALGRGLKALGLEPLPMPSNPFVDSRLAGHADLSILHTGGEWLYTAPFLRGKPFERGAKSLGLKLLFPDITQGTAYPNDAQLNLCIAGDCAFYNHNTACDVVVNHLTSEGGLIMLNCRQGYARCSVCVVDEKSIITSDKGIYALAAKSGYDALLISQGYIDLEGFEYGFIGGASFKISQRQMAFTGTLDFHPDRNAIIAFLKKHFIDPVYITEKPIFDIGSAIPITEM